MLPRDRGVLFRIVPAVGDVLAHGILNVLDHAAIDRQAENCREIALGHAVCRVDTIRLAELRNDIPVADDDAVHIAAVLGHRADQPAEEAHLIRQVLRPIGLLRFRERDGFCEKLLVHADVGRLPLFPLSRDGSGRVAPTQSMRR